MTSTTEMPRGGERPSTWLIVGASRGIGLEFVRQLLARGDTVIATTRDADPTRESPLSLEAQKAASRCRILTCDISSDASTAVRALSLYSTL